MNKESLRLSRLLELSTQAIFNNSLVTDYSLRERELFSNVIWPEIVDFIRLHDPDCALGATWAGGVAMGYASGSDRDVNIFMESPNGISRSLIRNCKREFKRGKNDVSFIPVLPLLSLADIQEEKVRKAWIVQVAWLFGPPIANNESQENIYSWRLDIIRSLLGPLNKTKLWDSVRKRHQREFVLYEDHGPRQASKVNSHLKRALAQRDITSPHRQFRGLKILRGLRARVILPSLEVIYNEVGI